VTGLEPEQELEVLAPERNDGKEVRTDSTSPGLVQSSLKHFWSGIVEVEISTGLIPPKSKLVYSDGISPMFLGASYALNQ
jgi:hypothetical protein